MFLRLRFRLACGVATPGRTLTDVSGLEDRPSLTFRVRTPRFRLPIRRGLASGILLGGCFILQQRLLFNPARQLAAVCSEVPRPSPRQNLAAGKIFCRSWCVASCSIVIACEERLPANSSARTIWHAGCFKSSRRRNRSKSKSCEAVMSEMGASNSASPGSPVRRHTTESAPGASDERLYGHGIPLAVP